MESKLPSDTFCILPWIHLSTKTNGILRPCCVAKESQVIDSKSSNGFINDNGVTLSLTNTDLLTAWNSEYMRNIRMQMLNGEKPSPCTKCFYEESIGYNSKRKWETQVWSNSVDISSLVENTKKDGSVPLKIKYLDLRLGNKCQLACTMCGPDNSTGWTNDWLELRQQITNPSLELNTRWTKKDSVRSLNWYKNNPRFWEQLYDQIPNLEQIYFVGGEPLIINEHYDLLEEIIKRGYAKRIVLRYNTNGVEWRSDLFDLWKHFKNVRVGFSLDGTHARNEFIRYPSKWEITEQNLDIFDKQTPDNTNIHIACTISLLNVLHFPDFIMWKHKQEYKKINKGTDINFHFLFQPHHLNIRVLPEWYKQKVKERYHIFSLLSPNSAEQMMSIVNYMEGDNWTARLPELQQYLTVMDKIRKNSWKEAFPELVDIFHDLP